MPAALSSAEVRTARLEAMLDCDQGRVTEAIEALDRLLESPLALTPVQQIECRLDRHTAYSLANRWKQALADLEAAEQLVGQAPMVQQPMFSAVIDQAKVRLYNNPHADTYQREGARAALARLRANPAAFAWLVDEMEADQAFQDKDWERCAASCTRAIGKFETEGWKRAVAVLRRRRGEAQIELGRLDAAAQDLDAALGLFANRGSFDDRACTHMAMARLQSRRGACDGAWHRALQALDDIESLIGNFRAVSEQQQFQRDKLRYYDEAFAIGYAAGGTIGTRRAWTIAERSKSFYLSHLLANADVPLFRGVDPELVRCLNRLEEKMDQCTRVLDSAPPSRGNAAELEYSRIAEEREQLLARIMKANPQWAAVKKPRPVEIEELLALLPRGWSAISYFWRNRDSGAELYIFSADARGEPRCTVVPWSSAEVAALDECRRKFRGRYAPEPDFPLLRLGLKLLPEGVLDRLQPDTALLISPHARVRGLPLHALSFAGDDYLIHRRRFQYVPTLSMLAAAPNPGAPAGLLLLGCPETVHNPAVLPGIADQIRTIRAVWEPLIGCRVRDAIIPCAGTPEEAGFPIAQWEPYRILHLACHGEFDTEHPFASALLLGRDKVSASEFFAVKLNAMVAILGACNLGRATGDEGSGDEWVGVYLPLFYAGARQTLVSLWEADANQTSKIMRLVHSALAQGEDAATALQSALSQVSDSTFVQLWANWYLVGVPEIESTGGQHAS